MTFTATVGAAAPGGGTPTGVVTFKNRATILSNVALSAGKASLTISTLTLGSHAISATYAGDGHFNGSSAALTEAVKQATSTTVHSSVNPSVFEQPVIFTATIAPNAATGTVTFKNGAVVLGTSSVVSGKATFSTSALAVGAHSITATYNGRPPSCQARHQCYRTQSTRRRVRLWCFLRTIPRCSTSPWRSQPLWQRSHPEAERPLAR